MLLIHNLLILKNGNGNEYILKNFDTDFHRASILNGS